MITLVNTFRVYGEDTDEFERLFSDTAAFLRQQQGFRGYQLVRSNVEPKTYFNIGTWATLNDMQAALTLPEMHEHHAKIGKIAEADPQPCKTVEMVSVDAFTGEMVHHKSR